MAAAVSIDLTATGTESFGRAEPFAVANTKSAASEPSATEGHTLSPRLSAPPPNVILASPPSSPTVTGTSNVEQRLETFVPQRSPAVENVVRLPVPTALDYTFDLRQQWEGVVAEVADDEFAVVLRDTSNPQAPEFDAVLPLEEVPDEDLPLLKPGAVLYWTIGYEHTRSGQVKRVSTLRLRRLPAWSKADIERVEKRAHALDALFEDGAR
ncbi:MAG: hypothetical protein JOZ69_01705 [Myxococcales bacterium]|nr:hypothetical protein [Myxococcales bacterium]